MTYVAYVKGGGGVWEGNYPPTYPSILRFLRNISYNTGYNHLNVTTRGGL